MLAIKPLQPPVSTCPNCNGSNQGFPDFRFYGWQIMGEGECEHCGISYHHTWPLGHGAHFPLAIAANGKNSFSPACEQWLARPLLRTVRQQLKFPVKIERKVIRETDQGLLLNCLDPCFGHIIWKLFNLTDYRDPAARGQLIVLIPQQCAWMVPEYVAEVWQVDVPLNKLHYQLEGLHQFIKDIPLQTLRMLPLKTHRDHIDIQVTDFFKHTPFPLEQFYQMPFRVTFIWREDRFWLRSRLEEYLYLAAQKFNWKFLNSWFCYRQLKSMEKVASEVLKKIPQAKFRITGLGNWGTFQLLEDFRCTKPDRSKELQWCEIYADSHMIVGVHGSGMLIPTALAGGFIELLPQYKIPHLSEDLLLNHPARYQLFLGRHLNIPASPRLVARHLSEIFLGFPYLYANTSGENR